MTDGFAAYVAAEVRAEMARQRVNQRTVAEMLGLSQAVLSDRMRGRVEFKISELERIARFLKVEIKQFLPDEEPTSVGVA